MDRRINQARCLFSFTRALSHRIRTPLSVLVNELTCLKSGAAGAECNLALKKCSEISDILKESTQLCGGGSNLVKFCLHQVLVQAAKQSCFRLDSSQADGEFIVNGVQQEVLKAFQALFSALEDLRSHAIASGVSIACGERRLDGQYRLNLRQHDRRSNWLVVSIEFGPLPTANHNAKESRKLFYSLNDLLCEQFGCDLTAPPLIDSVLYTHGCEMDFLLEDDSVRIDIGFPKAEHEGGM